MNEIEPLRSVYDISPLQTRIDDAFTQNRLRTVTLSRSTEFHGRRRRNAAPAIGSGCSAPETAARLVVHPNTVAYRLAKVERLTGRNLRRPDVRMELHLAVTVHELSGG
jgi:hypothetical protein